MRSSWLVVLLATAALSCNSKDTGTGTACGPNGECPAGFECDSKTQLCVSSGGGGVDAGMLDTILSQTPGAQSGATAVFAFNATESAATFECSVDGAPFAACVSPLTLTDLSAGPHTFAVRAVLGEERDATPATYDWTVSSEAPVTTITEQPPALSNSASAQIAFTVSPPGSTTACALDGAAPAACTSPASFSGLAEGEHRFTVAATAPDGTHEVDPPEVDWTVDTTAPTVTIMTRAGDCAAEAMRFSADESATFTCAVDDGVAAPCSSPFALPDNISGGNHMFTVVATDEAGNAAPAESVSFIIDRFGPMVFFVGTDPAADERGFSDATGAVLFHSDGTAVSYQCSLDGVPAADCSPSPFTDAAMLAYADLVEADNPHHLVVSALDACGNRGSDATFAFMVDTTGPTIELGAIDAPDDTGDVSVSYTASEPLASATCALDGFPCDCSDVSVAASCAGVSAGEHVFTIEGVDGHGNAGAPVTSSPFPVRYGPNAGHAILIGHDFLASSADVDGLLRNAFEQVPYRVRGIFHRDLRVAVLHEDTVAAVEADHALAAVTDLVDSAALEEFSTAGDLDSALRGKDLLLVLDQQDPAGIAAVGKLWLDPLTKFLDRGGVVVVLDGMVDGSDTPSGTYAVLGDGLLQVTGSADFGNIGSPDLPARRFDDANDALNAETITPLSVGTSYLTTASSVVFTDQDNGSPRWDYVRVTQNCTGVACFTFIFPNVIDKIFPVYSFSTGLPDTTGPLASIPFKLTPATQYDHIDCTATNITCNRYGNAPPCECAGGAQRCACTGNAASGFQLPFVTAGKYEVTLRLIDPYGSPGRSATSDVNVDLPVVTLTPSSLAAGTCIAVFCYRATTVDGRALSYALRRNGVVVSPDATKNASCAAADVGSFLFYASSYTTNTFRVDATDRYGNTSYSYVAWTTTACVF